MLICLIFSAQMVSAEDTVFRKFDVSSATSISGAGFLQGNMPSGSTAELKDGVIVLTNPSGASSTAANLIYAQGWSSSQTGEFVAEVRLKLDTLDGNPRIDFRHADGSYDYVLDIRAGAVYINRTLTDFTLGTDQWYTVQIYVQNIEEDNISLYIDGVKIGSYTSANGSKYKSANTQLRIEAIGKSVQMCIGDSSIYKPGSVSMQLEEDVLETIQSPVHVRFTSPVTGFAAEEVQAWCDDGTELELADVTVQTNAAERATGFSVEFANPLKKKHTYYITIGTCNGIFGQLVENRTQEFSVVSDEYDYSIADVKLCSGMADTKKQISALQKGFITFEVTVRNDGTKDGAGTILVEIYDGKDGMLYSGGVKKAVGSGSETTAYIGAYLPNGAADVKVRFVDNYQNKQDLIGAIGGDSIED